MVEMEKKRNCVWRKSSFVFRVCMGLVGLNLSESDPVVNDQFSRLRTARVRVTDLVQGPRLRPVFTRASCVQQEKRSAGARAKNADALKKFISFIVIQGSPSGMGCFPRGDASWHATGKNINRHPAVLVA